MKALVIGYGSIGKRHIENLSQISNNQIIVCTNRKSDSFLKKNKCKIVSSIESGIKEKPDFAIISNVTNLHLSTALKLANAGIHFLCEKPLSNNLKNISKLLTLVKRKNLITLMGSNFRFHPGIKLMKKMIENNEIGKVIVVHAENGSYLPNWHPQENYSQSYAARNDLGGGVVLTCIHEIDYLYWFFGKIKEVFSITGKFSDLKITADDLSSIILKFKNNVIGEIHLDYFQEPSVRNCKIVGTKGTILLDFNNKSLRKYTRNNKKWSSKFEDKKFDYNSMYVDELNYFINCVKKKKIPANDIQAGYETLKIAMAIINSGQKNKRVSIK